MRLAVEDEEGLSSMFSKYVPWPRRNDSSSLVVAAIICPGITI